MNYYALLVALVIITSLMMQGNREKNLKYVIVACILLYAIYGLRNTYHIGDDSSTSYVVLFNRMQNRDWSGVLEYANGSNVLFFLSIKFFCVYISTDYQLYVSVIAAFVTVCFGRMIYKYSPSPLQSILYHFGLLFFTFHFSALKQSIAMAILMLAFEQIVEKKPFRFVFLVLLACQFHFPALAFLPAYWIAKVKVGRTYLLLLAVLLVLTYLFRNQIINLMLDYYGSESSNVDLSNVAFLRTKALIMVIIVAAAVLFRTPTEEDRIYCMLLEFMGPAIVFQTFCGYNNIFERLADYYFQFSVIFLPMVFDKQTERKSLFGWRFLQTADTLAPYLFCGFGVWRFLDYTASNRYLSPFRFFFQ